MQTCLGLGLGLRLRLGLGLGSGLELHADGEQLRAHLTVAILVGERPRRLARLGHGAWFGLELGLGLGFGFGFGFGLRLGLVSAAAPPCSVCPSAPFSIAIISGEWSRR